MNDIILALIPLITSTGGIAIIAKVAISVVKSLAKKNNDKIELIKKQNARLAEENSELKDRLEANALLLKENLMETRNEVSALKDKILEEEKRNQELQELINQSTTIRNELRTLLEAKKE